MGYGIVAPEYRWDDYKDVDLKGKVLLIMNNDPEGSPKEPDLFAGKTRLWYGRWDYKYLMAARKGAAGAIVIHTTPSAGYGWQVIQTSWAGEQFELPDDGAPRVAAQDVGDRGAREEDRRAGRKGPRRSSAPRRKSRSFKPVPLGVTVSVALTNAIGQKAIRQRRRRPSGLRSEARRRGRDLHRASRSSRDPGGRQAGRRRDLQRRSRQRLRRGRDPLRRDARSRACRQPPARSTYFAFVAGEEQGLLGSEFLAKHPPVPAGRIAADINIDGIGWYGRTRDVVLIGLGKSSLDGDVEGGREDAGPARGGRSVPGPRHVLPLRPVQLREGRSSRGVREKGTDVIGKPPGFGREQEELYVKTDYHQPSDEFRETWDLSGAVEDVKLAFWLGCRVAERAGAAALEQGRRVRGREAEGGGRGPRALENGSTIRAACRKRRGKEGEHEHARVLHPVFQGRGPQVRPRPEGRASGSGRLPAPPALDVGGRPRLAARQRAPRRVRGRRQGRGGLRAEAGSGAGRIRRGLRKERGGARRGASRR